MRTTLIFCVKSRSRSISAHRNTLSAAALSLQIPNLNSAATPTVIFCLIDESADARLVAVLVGRRPTEPGHAQPSFDKQFVREYLETLDWNKQPPAPELPPEVAFATTERYLSAYKLLTGEEIGSVVKVRVTLVSGPRPHRRR